MILFISVLSFLLDGIFSKYISPNSLFLPLFTIVSIIIIYPYFNNNKFRYFKYIAILGLLYDIGYTNLLFYNFFIFMLLGYINIFIKYLLSECLYTNIIITIIIISIYRFCYFILLLLQHNPCSFTSLFKIIYSSFLINIIYCIIIYLLSEYISNKYKIVKSK